MNKGMLSVDEALERMLAGARPVAETETVPTLSAAGRVLAAAQRSAMNVPPLDNSAMDGYALRLAAGLRRRSSRAPWAARSPRGRPRVSSPALRSRKAPTPS
jgi:molybdopterin molybdotransferase